jgi:hypothetical protein
MGDNSGSDLMEAPAALPACAQAACVVHRLSTAGTVPHFVHMPSPTPATGLSTVVQLLADGAYLTLEAHVFTHELGDLLDRVERGRVVPSTKGTANHRER